MVSVNTEVMGECGTIAFVMDLGDRVAALLEHLIESGLSQDAIARKTREAGNPVTQAAISQWLGRTRKPKIDSAHAIGDAFGIDRAYFSDPGDVQPSDYVGQRTQKDEIDALAAEVSTEWRRLVGEHGDNTIESLRGAGHLALDKVLKRRALDKRPLVIPTLTERQPRRKPSGS